MVDMLKTAIFFGGPADGEKRPYEGRQTVTLFEPPRDLGAPPGSPLDPAVPVSHVYRLLSAPSPERPAIYVYPGLSLWSLILSGYQGEGFGRAVYTRVAFSGFGGFDHSWAQNPISCRPTVEEAKRLVFTEWHAKHNGRRVSWAFVEDEKGILHPAIDGVPARPSR
ncbi:hypothetical protein RSP_0087 [Pseudomonas phage RSP]|nr:hypothetical protein RSP_0087 [Pseudomonas phage RSP]